MPCQSKKYNQEIDPFPSCQPGNLREDVQYIVPVYVSLRVPLYILAFHGTKMKEIGGSKLKISLLRFLPVRELEKIVLFCSQLRDAKRLYVS